MNDIETYIQMSLIPNHPIQETLVCRERLVPNGIGEHRISLGRTKGWIRVIVTVEETERLI